MIYIKYITRFFGLSTLTLLIGLKVLSSHIDTDLFCIMPMDSSNTYKITLKRVISLFDETLKEPLWYS